jgi:hypothetical protein
MCGTSLISLGYVPSCVCTRNMNQVGASVGRCIHWYSLISPLQFTYGFLWQICTTAWRHQCNWYLLHTHKEKCRPYRPSKVVASMAAAGKASACKEMSAQGMSVHEDVQQVCSLYRMCVCECVSVRMCLLHAKKCQHRECQSVEDVQHVCSLYRMCVSVCVCARTCACDFCMQRNVSPLRMYSRCVLYAGCVCVCARARVHVPSACNEMSA